MKAFAIFGDTHTNQGMSSYKYVDQEHYPAEALVSSSWLVNLVAKMNAYSIPILGTGDLYTNAEGSYSWVSQITHPLGLIATMGNHDNATEGVLESLKNLTATFEYGYKGTLPIWHDVSINGFRILTIHNLHPDGETTDGYANVNPEGGYASGDWSGIGSPLSPQRVYMRSVMADAAAKRQLLVVCGHRAVYGIYTNSPNDRSNYVAARDATIEDGYPKGYVAELEDWAMTNRTHVLHVNGDQHTNSITYPIYRGAKSSSFGVIHLAVGTMNVRIPEVTDEAIHFKWLGGAANAQEHIDNATLIRGTIATNFSGDTSWVWQAFGICPYVVVEKEWDGVYINFYLWAHEGYQHTAEGGPKAPEQLVERVKIPFFNGALTGSISSAYGVPLAAAPTSPSISPAGRATISPTRVVTRSL